MTECIATHGAWKIHAHVRGFVAVRDDIIYSYIFCPTLAELIAEIRSNEFA